MNASQLRRLDNANADAILADLSTRQHLNPHDTLGHAMAAAQTDLGFCPSAAQTAIQWLRLDESMPIGRLRRSELIQLARSIHRFWRQALASAAPESQPA